LVSEPLAGLKPLDGLRVGHWTDREARTGCTVLLFDQPALAAAEVRGAAPGTRELALLQPGRLVQRIDAFLLAGGSAFGLAAADGVMRWLRERGRGVPTAALPVPIVPAAVIYDLAVGQPIAPDAAAGYAACQDAVALDVVEWGAIGAGTGATVDKLAGQSSPAGIGVGQIALRDGSVTAIAVLNALGHLDDGPIEQRIARFTQAQVNPLQNGTQTTLIAVVVDAECNHDALIRCCVAAHDALARTVWPAHTAFDGDLALAITLREGKRPEPTQELRLTMAVGLIVEQALRHAAASPATEAR
jgi:L-aminopeptidase/D-esterase-like protein